jgi:hypothetical protein
MAIRIVFLVMAIAAGLLTYFAARMQGVENGWRQVSAAIAAAIVVGICLLLYLGGRSEARSK